MEYIRMARELAGVYRDLLWLYDIARATWTPIAFASPEVELVACFRECTPMHHDEPVWFTDCEYDCEEWVHCGIAESRASGGGARPPRGSFDTSPSLAELAALPLPRACTAQPSSESTFGPSQADMPLRVPNITSGGSSVPAQDPRSSLDVDVE